MLPIRHAIRYTSQIELQSTESYNIFDHDGDTTTAFDPEDSIVSVSAESDTGNIGINTNTNTGVVQSSVPAFLSRMREAVWRKKNNNVLSAGTRGAGTGTGRALDELSVKDRAMIDNEILRDMRKEVVSVSLAAGKEDGNMPMPLPQDVTAASAMKRRGANELKLNLNG